MAQSVGFIGLGIMGRGMARNLIKSGFSVTVYNRTRARSEELAADGAIIAETPADAVRGKDFVITMLSDPAAVQAVIEGEHGLAAGLGAGTVLIDCSTVDPETSAMLLQLARSKGAAFLDSPVTGSKLGAEAGELVLLLGGEADVLEKARGVLEAMSKKIIHAGPSGSGTLLKLCFNLMVSSTAVALSESLVLGTKGGLNPQVVADALMAGALSSYFIDWKSKSILSGDFDTHFSTKLMLKDTKLITSTAQSLGFDLPTTSAVRDKLQEAADSGLAEEDFCSVVKVYEKAAGVEARSK